jgi:4-hydroxy-3-polyprenylbenzoate decarboxylase
MKLIVAMTGASGAVLGVRLLQELQSHEVHLIVSQAAQHVIWHEVGDLDLPAARRYDDKNLAAPIASSSCLVDAMVVIPCSMKTLAAIAHGYTSNLVVRAADNVLRMRRPLVLLPRETPLSLAALDNMRAAHLAGATILPPAMAYYYDPRSVDEVTDFFVGKVLDVLGLPHTLYRRWAGSPESGEI